jgi:TRAP-type C4-dicarboxylate transport system permease small subunit
MTHVIDRLTRLLDTVLASVILAMVAMGCLNVALRYGWGYSILWADETLVFAMIGVTFLGVISVSYRSQHLKMSLFVQALGPKATRVVQVLEHLLIAGTCLYVAAYSWKVVAMLIKRGTLSNMSNTPLWLLHSLVLVGLVGMAAISVLKIVQAIRGEDAA